jgi:creatinine amidohydrolase/Fe(II)-dependent formamide hydrolase-like protein
MNTVPRRRHSVSGLFFATLVVALLPMPAEVAPMPDTVKLEQLTWTEIRDAVRTGRTTIIIPVGGTEQSGPYIAVGKHNMRVAVLGARIARELGNALVAPVIAYTPEGDTNPPTSHMRFPGTITIPADVFERTIESAAESFRIHGFTTIVLIGDHGGYQVILKSVAERLNHEWSSARTPARVLYVGEYYQAVETAFNDELRARGYGPDIGTHADLNDTSLMLSIDPSMVRLQELQSAPKPDASVGVYGGDPRKASAALGRLGTEAQVSAAVQAIRRGGAR